MTKPLKKVTSERGKVSAMTNKDNLRLSNEESNQLTRECLCTALMKLMGDTPLDKISIGEIVECAGVSRMAFYRNYGTKQALADALSLQIVQKLVQDLKEGFATLDKVSWYVHFFETMQNNKDYLKIILSSNAHIDVKVVVDELFPSVTQEEHYFYIGRGGAFLHILTEWYRSGMKDSPEYMAALCERFFSFFRQYQDELLSTF